MLTTQVLAGPHPQTNFTRKYFWFMRYMRATGIKPTTEAHVVKRCDRCGKPMWVQADLAAECQRFVCHAHPGGV